MDQVLTRRQYLRARFQNEIIYVSDDHVFVTRANNISEGGVLLEGLSNIPTVNAIPLLISLPQFPEFSSLNYSTIMGLDQSSFGNEVYRIKARIVRSLDELSDFKSILVKKVGCEFVSPEKAAQIAIDKYVKLYAKNLVFLLSQFEKGGSTEEHYQFIRQLAFLLGHSPSLTISEIRFKALKDYQSLEE